MYSRPSNVREEPQVKTLERLGEDRVSAGFFGTIVLFFVTFRILISRDALVRFQ